MKLETNGGRELIVIGENIHATRVVLRKGKRVAEENGQVVVLYTGLEGEARSLPVPDTVKKTQDYEEGRVKHVQAAISLAMGEDEALAKEGANYIRAMARHQETAGADFLDLNVDEMSPKLEVQLAAMEWLVRTVQGFSPLPLSVDSSSVDVIKVGLDAYDKSGVRPMLNSASLERLDALDMAVAHNARVVVTAAGEKGMPDGTEERVVNASRMVDAALERGIALGDIYIDPLVFPVAVDTRYGEHCLDAIRALRSKYGPEIHITGGMSNVSFGIPSRRLLNEVFLILAVEAGADGGILDPVASHPEAIFALDRDSHRYKMAEDVLLGRDEHCRTYIKAWRKGELQPAGEGR